MAKISPKDLTAHSSKDQVFKSANMRYKEYNKSPVNKISSGKERPKKKQPE